MFSSEELEKLARLMRSRFNNNFHSNSISVMDHEVKLGIRMWFRYLEDIGVTYALSSDSEEGAVVRWGVDQYFIPEDLARKILLFGEFPPAEMNERERVLGPSAN